MSDEFFNSWNSFANRFGDFNGLRFLRRDCKTCGTRYFIDEDPVCPKCKE